MKFIILLFILFTYSSFGQHHIIDSLQIELKNVDKENEASVLNDLAFNYFNLNMFKKCLEYSNLALEKARETKQQDQEAWALKNKAIYFVNIFEAGKTDENYNKAIKIIYQAIDIAKKTNNNKQLVDFHNILYIIYFRKNDFVKQKEVLDIGLEYCTANKLNCPKLLYGFASYYTETYMLEKALEYINKSLDAAILEDDKRSIIRAYRIISDTYFYKNDFDKALEYALMAYPICKKLKDPKLIVATHTSLGEIYLEQKEYKNALLYLNKALSESKKNNDTRFERFCYVHLSNLYTEIKDYEKAIFYIKKSMVLVKEQAAEHLLPEYNTKLGKIYYQQKKYNTAYQKFKFSNKGAVEKNNWRVIEKNYKYLSKIDSIRNDYRSAFINYQKYKTANDSIFNQNKIAEITKMQTKFEVKKKDDEILLLNNNLDLEKRNKQKLLYISGLIITLISFFIIFLTYMLKNKKKIFEFEKEKSEKEIYVKNRELASFSIHIQQKNVLLTELKSKIEDITNNPNVSKVALKQLNKEISNNINLDEDWDKIKETFNSIYPNFFKKILIKSNNSVSQLELKYCAYLKMNISAKEIAQLLNIEHRSVYMSFYRIRKKLNVTPDEFMENFIF